MKYIKIYILITLSLWATSCDNEDFFEATNPPENPWLNLSEFEKAAAGAYWGGLRSGWDNIIGGPRLVKTCQSDIARLLPGTSANIPFSEMYNRTSDFEIDKTTNAFRNAYRMITIANSGLDFINDNDGNPYPSIGESDIQNNLRRIEGELYFIRGYAYYMLSTIHLPAYNPDGSNDSEKILPIRTQFDDNLDGAKSPELGTVEDIYSLMISDFTTAKGLLPERFDAALHHASYAEGRANRFAASAMLARVYFMIGMDTEALTELDYVIDENGGDYDLSEDPIEAFNHDDESRGKEVVWYAYYADPVKSSGNTLELTSMTLQSYTATNGGLTWPDGYARITWNQFALSYDALQRVGWMVDPENGDYTITEEALEDKRFLQLYKKLEPYNPDPEADPSVYETVYSQVTTPVVWSDKYYRGKTTGFKTNIPLIRLAEMYLTRSLLRLRNGNTAGATSDLNMIRNRAGIGDLETAITEDDIHNERIKELAFEGDRTDYLRSAKLDIPPGDRSISAVPYNDASLVWQLPQRELDLNSSYQSN
ncbi:RagB/SusD family nutrient uptake outer membrane protein [Chondrinema litorale]|uniref:RagB/SusD family nutrient uptake outer membrane protein n=1 Tax=Chondrinema litorale TaxID=2994555 RepID=UPI00254289B3|nr:RagB/SusD family nutrient uptake outer membrane protein [Chondrinema litorale]UZR97308.1 RagB/SusD family nutrient uptake outer membrane protein [Chondrinema litorale]